MPSSEPLPIEPLLAPVDAVVEVPGSKSLTNRALVCAALADGRSVLRNVLRADDTEAMLDGLGALGIDIATSWADDEVTVQGCAGEPTADVAIVDARLSGTTSRFLLPVAALGSGLRRVDGANRLRQRPMGPALAALRSLGADVRQVGASDRLPVELVGGSLRGGSVEVSGDVSSQFLSGLLLAGPAMPAGLTVKVTTDLVSRPYVDMTVAVMAAFGVEVSRPDAHTWAVEPQVYEAASYVIEPDASAASYAFAAAAMTRGTVLVEGLGSGSLQGDMGFVDLLERMGASVERTTTGTRVSASGPLRAIDADLSQISDTAQTLAVVAAVAEGTTRVRGIGFIRGKETDRIRAVVAELRRVGIEAVEDDDGFSVVGGAIGPATIETYDDHRMAMAFALLGLVAPGIRISDPGCVNKTFPGYWRMLASLRGPDRVVPS